MAPVTTKQWTIEGKDGFESLKFNEKAEIPSLGERDVLVHFHSVSLNYRDLIIPKVLHRVLLQVSHLYEIIYRANIHFRSRTM